MKVILGLKYVILKTKNNKKKISFSNMESLHSLGLLHGSFLFCLFFFLNHLSKNTKKIKKFLLFIIESEKSFTLRL